MEYTGGAIGTIKKKSWELLTLLFGQLDRSKCLTSKCLTDRNATALLNLFMTVDPATTMEQQ
jgi:hypothetical protein